VLDDRDVAAEATKHLSELERDAAAADDEQVFGERVQLHSRGRIEDGHGVDALDRERLRPGADVDEDQRRGDPYAVVRATPCPVGAARTGDHRFRGVRATLTPAPPT
jgi:hypothetical protein